MMTRLRWTFTVVRAGLYEWRGLLAAVVGACGALTAFAAIDPAVLPAALQPLVPQLREAGRWALLVSTLAGAVLAQSKKVLVPLPPHGAPTLLDDETDGNDTRAQVPWS